MIMTDNTQKPFWKYKKLEELTPQEWEAVCCRCGKCCLLKVKYYRIYFTNLACPFLNLNTGSCTIYSKRQKIVPECMKITPDNYKKLSKALPKTCAYRWLKEKKCLPPWHPLISQSQETIHQMGISIKNRAVHYSPHTTLEEHIVSWEDL